MRFFDRYLKGATPTGQPTRRSRSRRATARGAPRRSWPPADSTPLTTPLQRRHATPTTARTTAPATAVAERRGHLDDLAAAGARRALRGRAERSPSTSTTALPERQPRASTSTTSTPAATRPLISRGTYLLARQSGTVELRPLRRRLEAPGRPPRRRAGHRRQRRVVAARADAADGHRRAARAIDAAVPALHAHGDDPGRPVDQARGLPGRRAVHGRRRDHRRGAAAGLRRACHASAC